MRQLSSSRAQKSSGSLSATSLSPRPCVDQATCTQVRLLETLPSHALCARALGERFLGHVTCAFRRPLFCAAFNSLPCSLSAKKVLREPREGSRESGKEKGPKRSEILNPITSKARLPNFLLLVKHRGRAQRLLA